MDGHDTPDDSDECLLSPCETLEGSRHYAVVLHDEVVLATLGETAVMPPALLAQLRSELVAMATQEPLDTRPTQKFRL